MAKLSWIEIKKKEPFALPHVGYVLRYRGTMWMLQARRLLRHELSEVERRATGCVDKLGVSSLSWRRIVRVQCWSDPNV